MDIKMPKLGESVHEGTIEQWLVEVGDTIEEYQPLCEVITDKVTAEVPSSYSGEITELCVDTGETVAIGTVICKIKTDEIEAEEDEFEASKDNSTVSKQEDSNEEETTNYVGAQSKNSGQYSPVVFKLASQHQIDLTQVEGTGNLGRITKKDIQKIIDNEGAPSNDSQQSVKPTSINKNESPTQTSHEVENNTNSLPINGVRRSIANKMVQSVTEIPHAWMMVEADATELVKTRDTMKKSFKENEGYNLTYFAFFVKAVAEGLKAYPMLNSSWKDNEIIIHKDINISIAVASEDKLYVPVIKNADDKSIKGIAKEIHDLATRGRKHQLTSEDMKGGTFTVNNTGSFGSVSSMGIINHPQAAILQVESIVKRPVVIEDMIAIRNMVNLSLSIDHRILDGLMAGEFLKFVKNKIQNMTKDTTSIY